MKSSVLERVFIYDDVNTFIINEEGIDMKRVSWVDLYHQVVGDGRVMAIYAKTMCLESQTNLSQDKKHIWRMAYTTNNKFQGLDQWKISDIQSMTHTKDYYLIYCDSSLVGIAWDETQECYEEIERFL